MLEYTKYLILFIILVNDLAKIIVSVTTKVVLKEMIVNNIEVPHKFLNGSANNNRHNKRNGNMTTKWVLSKLYHAYYNNERKLKYHKIKETTPESGAVLSKFIAQKLTTNYSLAKRNRKWKIIKRKTSAYKIMQHRKRKPKDTRRVDEVPLRICGIDSYEDDLYGCEYSDEIPETQKLNLVQLQQLSEDTEEKYEGVVRPKPIESEKNEKAINRPVKDLEQANEESNGDYLIGEDQVSQINKDHKVTNEYVERNDKVDKEEQSVDSGGKSTTSDELSTDYVPPDIKEDLEELESISWEHGKTANITNVTYHTTSTPIIWLDGTVPKKQEVPSILEICNEKTRCRVPFLND